MGAGVGEFRNLPYEDIGFALVDHHRALRDWVPEVILGQGKSAEQVVAIARTLLERADRVLITLQTEFYAMEGLTQLIDTIRRVRSSLNADLVVGGILLTMVDRRNNLSVQVEDEVRGYFGAQVYDQVIPRNVRLSEAPSFGVPVMYHDIRSTGAQAYLAAARELIQREAAEWGR